MEQYAIIYKHDGRHYACGESVRFATCDEDVSIFNELEAQSLVKIIPNTYYIPLEFLPVIFVMST